MSTLLKSLLALAVALPLGAFVTGTLVASGDEPPARDPVIIDENTVPPSGRPTDRPEPGGTPTGDDDDDHGGDDDDIDVITPRPGDVGDDHSGPGGGGDDDDDDDRGDDDDDDDDGGGGDDD